MELWIGSSGTIYLIVQGHSGTGVFPIRAEDENRNPLCDPAGLKEVRRITSLFLDGPGSMQGQGLEWDSVSMLWKTPFFGLIEYDSQENQCPQGCTFGYIELSKYDQEDVWISRNEQTNASLVAIRPAATARVVEQSWAGHTRIG